jgi:hypothetical protein
MATGGIGAEEAAVAPIRLKQGRVPPNQLSAGEDAVNLRRLGRGARFGSASSSRFHLLLQFRAAPGFSERAVLEERGARVISYVPENAWICSAPEELDLSGLDLVYAGRLEADNKVSPQLELETEEAVTALAEFHGDVGAADARALLLGMEIDIIEHPDVAPGQVMIRGKAEAIRALASRDEAAYILPASEALRTGEPVAACLGGAQGDVPAAANLASRFGEGWDGAGLGAARVGYWLGAMANGVDAAAARTEIARAMSQWSAAAAIEFTPMGSPKQARSIDIAFLPRDHGDGFRFDGRGGVLAHTFYPPPNAEPIAGDLHLDIEEPWRIGLDVDVFSVALHELGHALGLGHNDDPNSVMYPYYRRVNGLRPADISEIRKLYSATAGATNPPSQPFTPVTPAPAPPPAKDTAAPTLTVALTPSSTAAQSIILRGLATDNVGVATVTWQSSTGASGAAAGLPQYATSAIGLNVGLNRITVRARDAAGNEAYRTVSITRR